MIEFDPVGMLYQAACEDGDLEAMAKYEAIMQELLVQGWRKPDQPDSLWESARWYASNGVPVLPLEPRGKRPLPGSHGLHDATTDLTLVDRWWARSADYNIGARTGVKFDVIDIDGPAGHAVFWSEVEDIPPIIGQSITSRPGGRHVFIHPRGIGNRAHFLPSVDYRGKGGYVVMPPSIGANGKRYQWLYDLDLS